MLNEKEKELVALALRAAGEKWGEIAAYCRLHNEPGTAYEALEDQMRTRAVEALDLANLFDSCAYVELGVVE